MKLLLFVLRRLAMTAGALVIVSLLIFAAVNILPGDVARAVLGEMATAEQVAALREQLGLNAPLGERYLRWIGGVLQGDLGTSLHYHVSVGPLLWDRMENSLLLTLAALVIATPLAIGIGVLASLRPGGRTDRSLTAFTTTMLSLPDYVIALTLVLLFGVWLRWLPASSVVSGDGPLANPLALVMPVTVLTLHMLAHMSQVTRASMIEVLGSPYIRTAVLKGLPRGEVIGRHALRNAMVPTVQEIGLIFGYTLGGLVVIETVFSYSGIGQLMVNAVNQRDVPIIQATVLLVATAYCLGNLLADLGTVLVNPRLRT